MPSSRPAGTSLVGFAHYLFQRSTWLVNPRCYLQDLYVGPEARGKGVGPAPIEAVAAAAKEAGAANVFWNTHETNAVARRLYDGLAERTGFIQYRIEPLRPAVASESRAPQTCRLGELNPCCCR